MLYTMTYNMLYTMTYLRYCKLAERSCSHPSCVHSLNSTQCSWDLAQMVPMAEMEMAPQEVLLLGLTRKTKCQDTQL